MSTTPMDQDLLRSIRDPDRLRAVHRTGLLDSDPEAPFDHLTRIAGRLMDAPLALVNLVDADRQFSKSCFAPPNWRGSRNEPLEESFCKYVVHTREPLLVEDTLRDSRFAATDMVRKLGIRSYIGIPLANSSGEVLGSLCVADLKPRHWQSEQVEMLREITALVAGEVQSRWMDDMTERAGHLVALADRERREKTALLHSTLDGIYGIDPKGNCTFLNPAGAAVLGYDPSEVSGKNMHRLVHHTRGDGEPYPEDSCPMYRALSEGLSIRVSDEVFWRKDGTCFPVEYASSPIIDAGEVRGAVVTFSDISERKREDEIQQFLGRASSVLAASSLDYAATLRSLAHLAVPTLGDLCTIYLASPDGWLDRLETAHADPAKQELTEALGRYPVPRSETHPVVQVLRTGEPILMETIPPEAIQAVAQDDQHRRLLESLGMTSCMVVPLRARGRTLGTLVVVATRSGRHYTPQDVAVAQEFAHRAALAVDNARLFQKSQEANQAKADFLATISHELRTPLNAVTGYAELMRQGIPDRLPPRSQEYVERIRLSARHLTQLIEEVLSFSRLEAGREVLSTETVTVEELVSEINAVIEPLATQKGLRLTTQIPSEPVSIRTDAGKLRQILLNLLDNAVKFTERGEIGVSARAEGEMAVIEVRDTGLGIRPEDRERVFEPFRQVEQSMTRSAGGTGLGLTVAHRLTELLGGTLTFTSVPGDGSTFVVTLPLERADRSPGAEEAAR